ncbi:DegT/DnrJ/EryC1/StrS family aminotransferase [Candidatus Pelagibacter communis]|uniref:DegT/DnrJ/EryC1/StrS family aminotransferase n=1 Tax=Pelagibacter ubique TaxID=198252 RepID=UPI00094D50CD|nr:DegT/DnrJ/EryC1/StrS family aminotransferase [Candidatus Pelagibacter ubique]
MLVKYSYLKRQFSNSSDLWKKLKKFVDTGDFTLGKELYKFEKNFSKLIGTKYAVGVNSGTDAIKLALKVLGVKKDDEVITAANTFVATVGAITEIGAKPVFIDCDDTFCMNVNLVEKKITKKTKAIVPVHFTGYMTDMVKLKKIAKKYHLPIIEDACQSILASINKKNAGTWGDFGAFSLHPLKNINVWSDGGIITTNNYKFYNQLKLLRNHGLIDRDTVKICGYNSRLDTFQAVVGNWLLPKAKHIANQRIKNANYYDKEFSKIKEISIPPRIKNNKIVYHLYIIFAKNRDALLKFCISKGIEAKVHYPIPIYRQQALNFLGHKKGDFPVSDLHTKKIITFPCDQHKTKKELDYVIKTVRSFYKK